MLWDAAFAFLVCRLFPTKVYKVANFVMFYWSLAYFQGLISVQIMIKCSQKRTFNAFVYILYLISYYQRSSVPMILVRMIQQQSFCVYLVLSLNYAVFERILWICSYAWCFVTRMKKGGEIVLIILFRFCLTVCFSLD